MSASNAGRVGVWGASGSGKSSYVKQQIKKRARVVVFDPLGEYAARQLGSVDAIRQAMRQSYAKFALALKVRGGAEPAQLDQLCRFLMRAQQPYFDAGKGRELCLVVEEMNLSFPVAGGARNCPGFAEICSRGRHYGIEVFGVSQRIAEVDTRFRGNCTETVVFRQKGARDRNAAAQELGLGLPDLPKQNLEYVSERAGTITRGKVTFGRKIKTPKPANTNAAPSPKKRRA